MSDPSTHPTFIAPEVAQIAPLFPGYDIEILIATGGMGAVYRAVQRSLDRKVAIKILPREFSKDKAFCAGFEAEAKAMARLNHPNLIGVYDFGEVDGMLFIIMEYVPGKSLFHSSHGAAIDPSEVIRLVTGICHGLAHAHENGILHRDIKPSNILLDLNAQPKIGDFGLARPIETKIQEGEEIFGTPHYTAPEVVSSPHAVDYRADIFSVGVLLHELLTGKLPADDRRPASAIAHCDPRFDLIIRRATHLQAESRYASATEIANELQHIASSAGPRILRTAASAASRNPSVPKRSPALGKPLVANPSSNAPFITILIIGAVIAALALAFMGSRNNETPPPPVDTNPPAIPTPPQTGNKPAHPKTRPGPRPNQGQKDGPIITPQPDNPASPDGVEEMEDPADPGEEPAANADDSNPTDPGPTTPEVKTSSFDVPAFFARAHALMKERAEPIIKASSDKLAQNLEEFDREAKRIVLRMDRGDNRDNAKVSLTELVTTATNEGHILPEKLPTNLAAVEDLNQLHIKRLEIQNALDLNLLAQLRQLSSVYIIGLEKQIERLDPEIDAKPIETINSEIQKTKEIENHFPYLMLGIEEKEETDVAEETNPTPLRRRIRKNLLPK